MAADPDQVNILLIDNRPSYLATHRRPTISALKALGLQVHAAVLSPGDTAGIVRAGVTFHPIAAADARLSPAGEFALIRRLRRLIRDVDPAVCHFITLRPGLYGLLASLGLRRRAIICSFTGLGYLFTDRAIKARLAAAVIGNLIRVLSWRRPVRFVFENPDDMAHFTQRGWISPARAQVIRGQGVDENAFRPSPLPPGPPVVLFPARYIAHKGIREFIAAARQVKARMPETRFVLVGGIDPANPTSLTEDEVAGYIHEGLIESWGFSDDMPATFARATLVVLPSYREGLPVSLLEAAACGRPLIAADVPGCREIVVDGLNGRLVAAHDADALARAIEELLRDPAQLAEMGRQSRQLVEREFTGGHVGAQVAEIYRAEMGRP